MRPAILLTLCLAVLAGAPDAASAFSAFKGRMQSTCAATNIQVCADSRPIEHDLPRTRKSETVQIEEGAARSLGLTCTTDGWAVRTRGACATWRTGDWRDCSASGSQTRPVACYQPANGAPDNAGTAPEAACPQPKPATQRACTPPISSSASATQTPETPQPPEDCLPCYETDGLLHKSCIPSGDDYQPNCYAHWAYDNNIPWANDPPRARTGLDWSTVCRDGTTGDIYKNGRVVVELPGLACLTNGSDGDRNCGVEPEGWSKPRREAAGLYECSDPNAGYPPFNAYRNETIQADKIPSSHSLQDVMPRW